MTSSILARPDLPDTQPQAIIVKSLGDELLAIAMAEPAERPGRCRRFVESRRRRFRLVAARLCRELGLQAGLHLPRVEEIVAVEALAWFRDLTENPLRIDEITDWAGMLHVRCRRAVQTWADVEVSPIATQVAAAQRWRQRETARQALNEALSADDHSAGTESSGFESGPLTGSFPVVPLTGSIPIVPLTGSMPVVPAILSEMEDHGGVEAIPSAPAAAAASAALASNLQRRGPASSTDAECHELILRWSRGEVSEREARRGLAALLQASGVALQVAREQHAVHYGLTPGPQLVQDIESELSDFLYRRITEDGPEAFFNLERALHSSTVGWARQTMRVARRTVMRTLHNRTIAHTVLVSPTVDDDRAPEEGTASTRAYRSATAAEVFSPDELTQRILFEEATNWLRSNAHHHRGAVRSSAGVAALRFAFGLPRLVRPGVSTRRRLVGVLQASPLAAHRAAEAMLGCLAGTDDWRASWKAADQDLMALWDDFSRDRLAVLVDRDPTLAHLLALDAISDRPRPDRASIRRIRATVRDAVPRDGRGRRAPGWATCADSLVNAYLAEEFEAVSAFDTTGSDTRAEKLASREMALDRAFDDYQRAVGFPGAPLGATHQEIRDRLESIFGAYLNTDVVLTR